MSQDAPSQTVSRFVPKVRVLTFIVLFLTALTAIGLGLRYHYFGQLNLLHAILIVFLSTNTLICYWEMCLFLRRNLVEERAKYWRQRQADTGRAAYVEYFSSKIPWSRVLSPAIWADVWATYAQFDPSFADRRTYGFNVDTGNGFVTFIPTLILYASLTVHFLPAIAVGVLGLVIFWQWTYMTSVYLASFFIANRHAHVSRSELYVFILGMNLPWVVFPLVGLYASVRIVVDGNFSVLL